MDSSPSTPEDVEEKTEIIYGIENIIRRTLECFSSAKIKVDSCVDALNPPTTMATLLPWRNYRAEKERS
jgi:hypothetical protein